MKPRSRVRQLDDHDAPLPADRDLRLPPRQVAKNVTCPNRWCNSSWYYEATDDAGRTAGYCQQCSHEVLRAPMTGYAPRRPAR